MNILVFVIGVGRPNVLFVPLWTITANPSVIRRACKQGLLQRRLQGALLIAINLVYRSPQEKGDASNLISSIICEPLLVKGALGNILTSVVSNSHFGKRPGASDFRSHIGSHIFNIGYMKVYGGIRRYMAVYEVYGSI